MKKPNRREPLWLLAPVWIVSKLIGRLASEVEDDLAERLGEKGEPSYVVAADFGVPELRHLGCPVLVHPPLAA